MQGKSITISLNRKVLILLLGQHLVGNAVLFERTPHIGLQLQVFPPPHPLQLEPVYPFLGALALEPVREESEANVLELGGLHLADVVAQTSDLARPYYCVLRTGWHISAYLLLPVHGLPNQQHLCPALRFLHTCRLLFLLSF